MILPIMAQRERAPWWQGGVRLLFGCQSWPDEGVSRGGEKISVPFIYLPIMSRRGVEVVLPVFWL